MAITNIPFRDTGLFPKLVMDYLSGDASLKPFYSQAPNISAIPALIEAKKAQPVDRELLVQTIREQYAGLEIIPAVQANTDSLLDPDTFCIVTAHQLNLFTGPLYVIYKTASIIRACKQLKAQYPQYGFVPVYWMGSEDHDFEEINHLNVFGKTLAWPDKQGGATGSYSTASLAPVLDELKTILGELPHAAEWLQLLQAAYAQPTLAAATRNLLQALFGEYGLVVIDGNCAALKRPFLPVMRDELLHGSSAGLVQEELDKLTALGYKEQASPREINLFYLKGRIRERIVHIEEGYAVLNTEKRFSVEAMLDELDTHPERFSPNVILRPLFQQAVLPALAYVGGAGELSYWLQLRTLFDHHNIPYPQLLLRNSVLFINPAQQNRMQKLGITASELFLDTETLKKEYVLRQSDNELSLSEEQAAMSKLFESIRTKAQAIDPTLGGAVGAEAQKAIQAIDNLEKRLLRALKQQHDTALGQLEKLKLQLFPAQSLQERYDNISAYYAEYGKAWITQLVVELDPYSKAFLVNEAE